MHRRPRWHALGVLAAGAVIGACRSNTPPTIEAIQSQPAVANVELVVPLQASDADGDPLTWSVSGPDPTAAARVAIEPRPGGRALLRWVPQVSEAGPQAFTVTVSDGEDEASTPALFDVAGSEEGTGPVFIQPLGTGATLDLTKQSCLSFAVEVNDPDSARIDLTLGPPGLDGAELSQATETGGSFSWCPTKDQVGQADRYAVTLLADDSDNPPTLKDFLLVLRAGNGEGCPGDAPVITHEPEDVAGIADIVLQARISDDQGMKYEPLLYFSESPPGSPPDVGAMTQLTMSLVDGDDRDGLWEATVPNPVANEATGSTAQLYYVVVAQDDDDPTGTCDHTTQLPAAEAFAVTVENTGGGGQDLCSPCSADAQCGGAGDLCVFLDEGYHCFLGCTSSEACPEGTYCSFSEFPSVDGESARQCIPENFECDGGGGGGGSCVDDAYEDNDSAATAAAIPLGDLSGLTSCPASSGSGDDEDFYLFTLPQSEQITIGVAGTSATDLDLQLFDAGGTKLDESTSLSSMESVSGCLDAGTYLLRVYAYGMGENAYSLTMSATPSSCGGSCTDDPNEDDDDALSARFVDLNAGPYTSTTQAICSGDDDWYVADMFAGETLHATLEFLQASPSEDLDLYVFDDNLQNLTGCDESTPSGCDPLNGQSGTSDETLAWPINQTGTYYVVVHGWYDAENLYDICIGLSASECP